MRRSRLVLGIATAPVLVVAVFITISSRAKPLREPASVIGYSANFIEQDLQHPENNSSGTIHVNAVATPRGIAIERNYAGRKRIELFAGTPKVLDPLAKTFWVPHYKSQLRARAVLSGPGNPPPPLLADASAQSTYIGRETINGRDTYHWQIAETLPDGKPLTWQLWQDVRTETTVKSIRPQISSYELSDLKEGPQAATWFEIPVGYRQIDSPPASHPAQ